MLTWILKFSLNVLGLFLVKIICSNASLFTLRNKIYVDIEVLHKLHFIH